MAYTSFLHQIKRLYIEAYSHHPKEIWALALVTLINRMGTMVLPFLTVYITTVLGYSFQEAGFLAGSFGFGSLGGSYLGGKITDRWGPRIVIILSLILGGLFFIGLQFAQSFQGLLAMIFLTALFGEAYRPAMSAAAASFVKRTQTGRTMALLRLAINIGMAAAPALGGFVAASLGYTWLFWIDGLTCITAGVLFFWRSRSWHKLKPVAPSDGTGQGTSPGSDRRYWMYLAATFLVGFVFMQWLHTVPVFIKISWGFDERYIGVLLALNSALVALLEMPAIHMIERKGKILGAVLWGIFLIAVSYLAFVLPGALIWCFTATVIWSIGEILFLPFNNSIPLNMAGPTQRGRYMSWYWMTWSAINIAAPIAGFTVIEHIGYQWFWVGLVGVGALGLILMGLLGERMLKE